MIEKRLENARNEIQRWTAYDFVLVNDDLEASYAQVVAILTAERLRRERVSAGVAGFVRGLLAG